jgi:hypothetical protein
MCCATASTADSLVPESPQLVAAASGLVCFCCVSCVLTFAYQVDSSEHTQG